jgi:hypothetical protein
MTNIHLGDTSISRFVYKHEGDELWIKTAGITATPVWILKKNQKSEW